MKRIIRLMLVVCFVAMSAFGFYGCGPSTNSDEILFWAESVGINPMQFAKYAEYFNKNNPDGYTLKYEFKDSLTGSLREARTAGIGPDVVSFPRWETATSSVLVKDLTGFIGDGAINITDYNAEAVKECTVNGKIYGVPTDVDGWGLWVNQKMVDDYNTAHTDSPIVLPIETWAEWKAVAQKLTVKEGGNFTTMGFNSEGFRGMMYTMMQTAGVNYVDTSIVPSKINLPTEETNAVFDFMEDMIFKAGVYTPHTESVANFYQGKVAMQFGSTGFKAEIDTYAGKENAMNMTFMGTPARSETLGKVSGIIGGFGYSIPNIKSVNAEKSWKAIKWMLSDPVMTQFCALNGVMPAKTKLQTDELLESNPTFMTMRNLLPTYVTRPAVRGYTTMEVSVMFGEMDKFISGSQKKAATIANMIANGNQIFEMAQSM